MDPHWQAPDPPPDPHVYHPDPPPPDPGGGHDHAHDPATANPYDPSTYPPQHDPAHHDQSFCDPPQYDPSQYDPNVYHIPDPPTDHGYFYQAPDPPDHVHDAPDPPEPAAYVAPDPPADHGHVNLAFAIPEPNLAGYAGYATDHRLDEPNSGFGYGGHHLEASADGLHTDIYVGSDKVGTIDWPLEKVREWQEAFGHDPVRVTFETAEGFEKGLQDGNVVLVNVMLPDGVHVRFDESVSSVHGNEQHLPPLVDPPSVHHAASAHHAAPHHAPDPPAPAPTPPPAAERPSATVENGALVVGPFPSSDVTQSFQITAPDGSVVLITVPPHDTPGYEIIDRPYQAVPDGQQPTFIRDDHGEWQVSYTLPETVISTAELPQPPPVPTFHYGYFPMAAEYDVVKANADRAAAAGESGVWQQRVIEWAYFNLQVGERMLPWNSIPNEYLAVGRYGERAIWYDMHGEHGKAGWEMVKGILTAGLLVTETEGAVYSARAIGNYLTRIDKQALAEFVADTRGSARLPFWKQTHDHHVTPRAKEFEAWYRQAGVDPDNYCIPLRGDIHLEQIHGTAGIQDLGKGGVWNELWRQFMKEHPRATKAQIEDYARSLLKTFELPTRWRRYRSA